ncbi:MAG: hypothetical protein AAB757_02140 [Patescibacteria group bacterium]
MQVTAETTILEVHAKKAHDAQHLLHAYLCKCGKGYYCCNADLTIGKATELVGKETTPLIEQLNLVPDKGRG